MTFKTGFALAACAASAFLLTSGTGFADMLSLKADLSPSSEVPSNTSKGTGSLTGSYDTVSKTLSYTVTYANLTGPAVAAHFHAPAPAGKNAGVEIPVKSALDSPITGTAVLTDDQVKNLLEGMTYFNIHTAANKGGEMRGQVSASQ